MDAGPHRASRAIEELRLQLAVDKLVADGALPLDTAFEAPSGLERVLGERGLLGLDLEALGAGAPAAPPGARAAAHGRRAALHRRRAVEPRGHAARSRRPARAERTPGPGGPT